jgi:hypothetical protein
MTGARDLRASAPAIAAIGIYGGSFALAGTPIARVLLLLPLILISGFWWMIAGAQRWIPILAVTATLLPPLPLPLGDSGPHPALLPAMAGMLIGLARLRQWRFRLDAVSASLLLLLAALLFSAGLAVFYSGAGIAAAAFARIGLFGIGMFAFMYAAHGPGTPVSPASLVRLIFALAVLGSAFACLDFYLQFPAPSGFSPQFIWLSSGVVRRAQGLYYEASTLGNFCAFVLVMIAVALLRRAEFRPVARIWLLAGGSLLATALVLSYSRASLLNVLAAICALILLSRARLNRSIWIIAASIVAAIGLMTALFPAVVVSYWIRLSASVQYLWSSPEGVLSGRLASWRTLVDFLAAHPWHLLFGIGYKTLPYSDIAGRPVIVDNMYLSLLAETGVAGLLCFLLFSYAVMRESYRAARSAVSSTSFLGTWMFCFWAGQLVQMLSGDLLTYWRVLLLHLWVIGVIVRRNRHETPVS